MPTLTWKDNRLNAIDIAPYDTTVMLTGPQFSVSELPQTIYGFTDDKKYDGKYYRHLPLGERIGPL
jgi:hypothetical protein